MKPTWGWTVSTLPIQPFAPSDSKELELLFQQQKASVNVTLQPTSSIMTSPVSITVQNQHLNCMSIMFGWMYIVLHRTYSELRNDSTSVGNDQVYFYTSQKLWLPYDIQHAALVCDAWRYKRHMVWILHNNILYIVFLQRSTLVAWQYCVLSNKSRTISLIPTNK